MSYEMLIGVIPSKPYKQEGVGDIRGDKLFRHLWNEKYPDYPVVIKMNPHDYGSYPDIQIREEYWNGFNNDERTNGDIETAAFELVDNWNEQVQAGEITELKWKDIRERANLATELPFVLEY
jgi:hypothetical protein